MEATNCRDPAPVEDAVDPIFETSLSEEEIGGDTAEGNNNFWFEKLDLFC